MALKVGDIVKPAGSEVALDISHNGKRWAVGAADLAPQSRSGRPDSVRDASNKGDEVGQHQ